MEDLTEAFIRLYRNKPLHQISVKEVAGLAGYNRSTFYIHYDDIPDLLEKAEQQLLIEIRRIIVAKVFAGQNPLTVDLLFEAIKEVFSSNLDRLSLMMVKPGSIFPTKLIQLILQTIQSQFPESIHGQHAKLELAITYQISAVVGVMSLWLAWGKPQNLEEMMDYIKEISNEGVFNVVLKNI